MPMRRERTLALIRQYRAMGLRRPRRRLPRQVYPGTIETEYFKAIREWLERARALLERRLFPILPGLFEEARLERGDAVRTDAGGGRRVNKLLDELTSEFFTEMDPGIVESMAARYADATSRFQRDQLRRQVRAGLGVDVLASEPNLAPLIENFTAENVALIRSIPSRYLEDVEARVTSAMRSGLRWEEVAEEIGERYEVSEARAKLVARDQVGKFFGDLNRVRQQEMGVTSYVWRTMRDSRVRPEHEALDGESFKWSDAPPDGHPGEAINCRCYAEPDLSGILDGL